MDDQVTWLRAQLDEDERVAQEAYDASRGGWALRVIVEDDSGPDRYLDLGSRGLDAGFGRDDQILPKQAAHIARHDPVRVLAEVAAKRRRIDELVMMAYDDPADETASFLLRLETQPFADRPGYRPEWAPDADPTVG